MNKTLRYALIAAATAVVLILVLPFVVPVDTYRDRIESSAAQATGRTLRIEGPLRLMFFPQFGLRAERVTFANMPGGRAAAMASVGDIKLAIRFLPLLTGHVEVAQIVLDHPIIALEVDAAGQPNWDFSNNKNKTSAGESAVTLPLDTQFSGIKVTDGRITYDNANTGTHRAIDHVNATIGITQLDRPVTIDGNLTEADHQVDFDARIVTVKSLLTNGMTVFDLSLTSDMMQASFKGLVKPDGTVDGRLKLDTANLRRVADWLGEALPEGGGFGGMSLESHVISKDKVTMLSPLRLTIDHQNMTGSLAVDMRGNVTAVKGTLSADRLDLNPYMAAHAKPSTPVLPAETAWNKEPINIALLKKVDAQLSLNVGSLRLRGLKLGHTSANVTLAGGNFIAQLDPITLYAGTGQATLHVDGRGPVPYIHNVLRFDHVSLKQVLGDALGIDSIEGIGSLTLDISAQGANADAVMHNLSGKGTIAASDGRFRGIDMGRVASTIQTMLGGDATGDVARTDFHSMGGTFVIAGGILTNKDFHLAGPLVQMTGTGDIDIGNRTIDFRLVPKAVVKGASVGIPFRVSGSWDRVHYSPDLAGIVGGVMNSLESGESALKGLFGGDKQQNKGNPKKKKSVGDTLKNMFGIH